MSQLIAPVSKDKPSHPRAKTHFLVFVILSFRSWPKSVDQGTEIDIPLPSIHLSFSPQSWPRSWEGQMQQTWGSKQLQDYKHCINMVIITCMLCCYSHNERRIYLFCSHTYSPVEGGFVLSRNPVSSHFQRKKQSSSWSIKTTLSLSSLCQCWFLFVHSMNVQYTPPKNTHAHTCTKPSLIYCFVHIVLTLKITHLMNRPGVKVQLVGKPVIYLQVLEPPQDSLILK